jgi:PAS domain S-box-containing protein
MPEFLRQEGYLALLEHPTNFIAVFEAVRTETGAVRDWRYVEANRNILRVMSTTREDLLGKCVSEVAPERAERLIPTYAGVLETGVPNTYETTWGGADYLICVFPMGRNAVVTSGSDITARKHAEDEVQHLLRRLSAERDWLLAALHSINDEVYFTDPQGRYLYANPTALRAFGHSSIEGVPVETIVSKLVVLRPDGTPRPMDEAPPLRALKGEVIRDEEQIVRLPLTGELRHRQVSSAPVRDVGGAIIGSVSVVRDITDSKHAEARLREAVNLARAAESESRAALATELAAMKRLHSLSTTAITTDDQQMLLDEILEATMALHDADFGSIRFFDAAANTLTIAAHRGLPLWYLDRFAVVGFGETPVAGVKGWGGALGRRERVTVEDFNTSHLPVPLLDVMRAIGSRAMQSTPLFAADGTPVGTLTTMFASPRSFSVDELRLTDLYAHQAGIAIERQRTEAALGTALESAERANKAKSHFVRAASHDLRQSVQALAMLNRSLRSVAIDATHSTIVRQQSETIETMAHLLDALLNISRLESGMVRPEIADVPVAPLFEKLHREFSGLAAGKGLVLRLEAPRSTGIRSDSTLVGEILRNLLSNAIKFTPRGSITLRCLPLQDTVRLEVIDTGIGIPDDEMSRIFDEFYQIGVGATGTRDGHGLGLSIVQRMAVMLETRVDVESHVGRGSLFSLTVPASAVVFAQESADAVESRSPSPAERPTILLVEDDRSVRTSIARFFRVEGYRIVSTESFDQTLALIGEQRPDLLITDFHLADGKTGLDVIHAVRQVLGAAFPAILLSGDTSADVALLPHDARVRFASKPIDPDLLVGLVHALLAAGS